MSDPVTIRYEALQVADVVAQADADLAVVVLETDQGRIGRHMTRSAFEHLIRELEQASSRGTSPSRTQ